MKLIVFLCAFLFVSAQDVVESVSEAELSYEFKSDKSLGLYIAAPEHVSALQTAQGLKLEYAFTRRKNKFYEIVELNAGAKLTFSLNSDISTYTRSDDALSVNKLFFEPKSSARSAAFKTAGKSYLTDPKSIIIRTEKRGVHKLTYQDFLQENLAVENIQTSNFKLMNKGQEVPIFIESGSDLFINKEGEYILFFAERNKNTNFPSSDDIYYDPYDRENVYWLIEKEVTDIELGKRLHLESVSNNVQNAEQIYEPEFFHRQVHLEENTKLGVKNIPNVEAHISNNGFYHDRDFYFWGNTITSNEFQSYNVDVLNDFYVNNQDSAHFSVMMSGSASSYAGVHKAEFKVSSASYIFEDDFNWRNSYKKRIDFSIPLSALTSQNTFDVRATVSNDQLLLNSIDIEFPSRFIVTNNYLEFSANPPEESSSSYTTFQYKVSGFTTNRIIALKIGEAFLTSFDVLREEDGKYSLYFQDEIENENAEFVVVRESDLITPNSFVYNSVYEDNKVLRNIQSNAEMLLVTTPLFAEKAAEYAEYKTSQGLQTDVVLTTKIYNEFNNGHKSPVSIKEFLKYAYESWSSDNHLKFVTFVGDGKRDYGQGNREENVVPTFQFISSRYGFVAADPFYGYLYHTDPMTIDFKSNPIMDLYVGRIPAESIDEFDAYLQKLKEFDLALPQEKSLFLGGNDYSNIPSNWDLGSTDRVFVHQIGNLNSNPRNVPNYTFLKRASNDPIETTTTVLQESSQLQTLFNTGLNYVTFLGHGAGAVWGDRNIFLQDDAARLQNKGRYPLVSSYTCFIGAFDGGRTLGEELILLRNKGAIGVVGSSGVSLLYNQYSFGTSVNDFVFLDRFTYGEALSLGKHRYYQRGANYLKRSEVAATASHYEFKKLLLMQFNYLGDPSVSVKTATKKSISVSSSEIEQGQSFSFSVDDIESNTYQISYSLMDYYGEILKDTTLFTTLTDSFVQNITIPELTENEETYYLKGALRSSSNVYNFGTVLQKQSNINVLSFNVVDPTSLENRDVLGGADYKFQLTLNDTVQNLTANVRLYMFDHSSESDRFYRLAFSKTGENEYTSDEVYRLSQDAERIYLSDIRGTTSGGDVEFRNTELQVTINKYLLRPIENTFRVSYTDRTQLQASFTYPMSFTDTLLTFVDFYRIVDTTQVWLGSDSLTFTTVSQNKDAALTILEDYESDSVRYLAKIRSENRSLELDTAGQKIISDFFESPSALIQPTIIDEEIPVSDGLTLKISFSDENFGDNSESSLVDVRTIAQNSDLNLEINNFFENSAVSFEYLNDGVAYNSLNENNFQFVIAKEKWRNSVFNRITVLAYSDFLGKWVEVQKKLSVDADSSLVIGLSHGIRESSKFLIGELESEEPFRIVVSTEVDGFKGNRLHYTSLNPQLKFNLNSQNSAYLLSPQNVKLHLVETNGSDTTLVPFSYSYSGVGLANLNILVDGDQHFNNSGSFDILLSVDGYTTLYQNADGVLQILQDNEFHQKLQLSGKDQITVYGNYPNPFGSRTIFGFNLSSSTSNTELDLEIKIYSMSGRLVKHINSSNIEIVDGGFYDPVPSRGSLNTGINYVLWDGKNNSGKNLANGVYFAKVIYKTENKTIEKVMKIAKLNGYN